MDKEKKLSRRKFLRTALITAGIIGLSNIDIPEWVEELEEPTIYELARICTEILEDIETAEILIQPNLGRALGLAFTFLLHHGEEPEQYLIGKKFLQGEVNKIENREFTFPIEELMVSLEDRARIENKQTETYSTLTDLSLTSIGKNKYKLRIRTGLIPLPRLSHVTANWLEFNSAMIREVGILLGENERLKILATVLKWETENRKNVRYTGAISENQIKL